MPDAPRITLYRDKDTQGRKVELTTCGSSNLGNDYGFNDQTSSIVVSSGIWLVYDDANYSGEVYLLVPGEYRSPGMWKGKGDAISSLRPLPQAGVDEQLLVLFKDSNYGGRMVGFKESMAALSSIDFNDQASSAIVLSGSWLLCEKSNYDGGKWLVSATGGPNHDGRYPSSEGFFDNDVISSVQREK